MIQHATARRPASTVASAASATGQTSQLWARRMGLQSDSTRKLNSTVDLTRPPMLSPIIMHVPRPATLSDLHSGLHSSVHSARSQCFFSDIWTPRECDKLSPASPVGTPIYLDHRRSFGDLKLESGSLSTPASFTAARKPHAFPFSAMDKDNMEVAVQVALQIIGRDGGYDSDDEQYCRQALGWLQDGDAGEHDPSSRTAGFGRARSKTDATDKLMLRDDGDACGMADDDGEPKRKGRARMSQEKRRRLARRKEREALTLLGLPPMPSSAPARTTTFRLPPLITNTLASVASSNLSPEERAAAVEAARVLVASTGLISGSGNWSGAKHSARPVSIDLSDRRQSSVPDLRAANWATAPRQRSGEFASTQWESGSHRALPAFSLADAELLFESGFPGGAAASTASYHRATSNSSHGMPSLSRGGSVASSPAGTPLQTPDSFVMPLPPTSYHGDGGWPNSGRAALRSSGGSQDFKTMDSLGLHGFAPLHVPNVRVMPPTPHNNKTMPSSGAAQTLRMSAAGNDSRQLSARRGRTGSLSGGDEGAFTGSAPSHTLSQPARVPALKRSVGSFTFPSHAGEPGSFRPTQYDAATALRPSAAAAGAAPNSMTGGGQPGRRRSQTSFSGLYAGPAMTGLELRAEGVSIGGRWGEPLSSGYRPSSWEARDYAAQGGLPARPTDRSMGPPPVPARFAAAAKPATTMFAAAAPSASGASGPTSVPMSISGYGAFSTAAAARIPPSAHLAGPGPPHPRAMVAPGQQQQPVRGGLARSASPVSAGLASRYMPSSGAALGLQLNMGGPLDC